MYEQLRLFLSHGILLREVLCHLGREVIREICKLLWLYLDVRMQDLGYLLFRPTCLGRAYIALLLHKIEHQITSLGTDLIRIQLVLFKISRVLVFFIFQKSVAVRGLRQCSERGTFRKIKLLHILSEICMSSCIDTIAAISQIYCVQIRLKDLVLSIRPFDLEGVYHLTELSAERSLALYIRKEHVPGQLLSYSGRTAYLA